MRTMWRVGYLTCLLVSLIILLTDFDFAKARSKQECQVIGKISYELSGWFKPKAVAGFLSQKEGDCFDTRKFGNDIQQLKNLGSIKKLDYSVNELPNGTLEIKIHLDYGWPVVPSIFYQSGAFQQFHIGAFAPSFMGLLHELGANYTWRNGQHLFNGWYTAPNLFGRHSTFDFEIAMTGNVISKYGASREGRPVPVGLREKYSPKHYKFVVPTETYEVLLRGGLLDFSYNVVPSLLTMSFRYLLLFEDITLMDNYSNYVERDLQDLAVPELTRYPFRSMPLSLGVLTLKLGKLSFVDQYRWRGHQLNAFLVGSHRSFGSGRDFLTAAAIYRGFIPLSSFDILCRVGAATTTSDDFFDYLNIGSENFENLLTGTHDLGLTNVRGFRSGQFRGQNILYGNIEFRARLVHDVRLIFKTLGNFTLQAAAFADFGMAWNKGQFVEQAHDSVALSVGGGLLMTLQAFRDTYVNYYIAHTLTPFHETSFNIVMTKSFF